jgi:hypothetical protein
MPSLLGTLCGLKGRPPVSRFNALRSYWPCRGPGPRLRGRSIGWPPSKWMNASRGLSTRKPSKARGAKPAVICEPSEQFYADAPPANGATSRIKPPLQGDSAPEARRGDGGFHARRGTLPRHGGKVPPGGSRGVSATLPQAPALYGRLMALARSAGRSNGRPARELGYGRAIWPA